MALSPQAEFAFRLQAAWARGHNDGKRGQKFTWPFDKTPEVQVAYLSGYHKGEIDTLPAIAEAA
jgi:hypothetical protein